jgi:hypothetical protein
MCALFQPIRIPARRCGESCPSAGGLRAPSAAPSLTPSAIENDVSRLEGDSSGFTYYVGFAVVAVLATALGVAC